MNRMSLKFLRNDSSAELFESEFSSSLVGRTLRCARGRYAFTECLEGTFLWTSAVQSMSAVAIKSKIAGLTRTTPQAWPQAAGLCSDATSWALSLDFALSKKPRWLLDMFGVDQTGAPIIKRLFIRMNPEKKRPGPVWVSINPAFLDPSNIAIFLDGVEVTTLSELNTLLRLIGLEGEVSSERESRSGVVKLVPKGTVLSGVSIPTSKTEVLIPFLDHFILELGGYGTSSRRDALVARECRLAFRMALMAFGTVFVPAVSYVQSPLCRKIVDEHYSFAEMGAMRLVTDAPTWGEFFDIRRGEYAKHSRERALYSSLSVKSAAEGIPFKATGIDTTQALHDEWRSHTSLVTFQQRLLGMKPLVDRDVRASTSALQIAAEETGKRAFIAKNLALSAKKHGLAIKERDLTTAICDLFFSHYRSSFDLGLFDDLAYGVPVRPEGKYSRYSFTTFAQKIRSEAPQLLKQVEGASADDLWKIRSSVAGLLSSDSNNGEEGVCALSVTAL